MITTRAGPVAAPALTALPDAGRGVYFVHTNLAAAYAGAVKMDEAKAELAEARRLNPTITIKSMKEHAPNLPAVFDGLRKAGVSEE